MKINTRYRQIQDAFTLKGNALFRDIAAKEPKSVSAFIPITWKKAVDFSVWDDRGNKWIDLTSAIFVTNAGHANQQIKRAIKKQVDADLLFAYNYPTQIKKQFIDTLLALSPKHLDRVTLLNSGSEAMDIVYKLIKQYGNKHKKKYIISFKGNYHGRGLSNDLISGNKERASWSNVTDPGVHFLEFPYEGTETFDPKKLPPHKEIAGFVVETFQGWGAWMYPKGFLNDLSSFAKKVGALVAFDEMQAGFYRMGPLYGYMTYGSDIKPDILGLGKGISSSLPLGAVLSRKEIIDLDEKADLHGTQSGNAVVCAAALANIEFLSDKKRIAAREKTMRFFEDRLRALTSSPLIKQVNVRGMIAALIFHTTEDATRVVHACIRNGVLPVCTNKHSIKIAPPLTITIPALREVFAVLQEALY